MITETVIPPLPSEQDGSTIGARCWWVVLIVREHQWRFLSAEMEHIYALGEFQRFFGREPDKIHSPPESKTRYCGLDLLLFNGIHWQSHRGVPFSVAHIPL